MNNVIHHDMGDIHIEKAMIDLYCGMSQCSTPIQHAHPQRCWDLHATPLQNSELCLIPGRVLNSDRSLPIDALGPMPSLIPGCIRRPDPAKQEKDTGGDVRGWDDLEGRGLLVMLLIEKAEGDLLVVLLNTYETWEPVRNEVIPSCDMEAQGGQSNVEMLKESTEGHDACVGWGK
jgi:hypothetical protein